MPSTLLRGAAAPPDPEPTVRGWFDALARGDGRALKMLSHPDIQLRGEGPPPLAPAADRRAVLERARAVRRGQMTCPRVLGVERLPDGGLMVTWELPARDGRPGERGVSFLHAAGRVVRFVATHALADGEAVPPAPTSPVAAVPQWQRRPTDWQTLREQVRVQGGGWLGETARGPLPRLRERVPGWAWWMGGAGLCAEIGYLLVEKVR